MKETAAIIGAISGVIGSILALLTWSYTMRKRNLTVLEDRMRSVLTDKKMSENLWPQIFSGFKDDDRASSAVLNALLREIDKDPERFARLASLASSRSLDEEAKNCRELFEKCRELSVRERRMSRELLGKSRELSEQEGKKWREGLTNVQESLLDLAERLERLDGVVGLMEEALPEDKQHQVKVRERNRREQKALEAIRSIRSGGVRE